MFPLSISISDPVDDEGDDINQELERKAEEQALQVIALLKVCIDSCVYIQALRSNQTVVLELYTLILFPSLQVMTIAAVSYPTVLYDVWCIWCF